MSDFTNPNPETSGQNPSRNAQTKAENWFASWFDTPYYHILYKDRNYREAQIFMDNLTHYLNLPEEATILDLACGKGRHSIYLNQLGFKVLGADLSENSIAEASKNTNTNLSFKVHDMREPFEEKFDAIFNLFTSFGYFESDDDNLTTLKAIKESLSAYGFAVIDFMNVTNVIEKLVPEEIKIVDDIHFHIKRYVKDNHIVKEISFEDTRAEGERSGAKGEQFNFTEKVKALTLQDFQDMMDEAGIFLLDIFGDYKLKKFHKTESERLIMIFK